MSLSEGQILEGKYRIDRLLSKGGMGAVYLGHNSRIRRNVAIKVLLHGAGASADAMMRFEKEAQAAGRIGSDHIVEVLDLGTTPEGDRFMVMEYLDGETLKSRIASRGRLAPVEVIPVITQLLEGLAAAHAAKIIHRDLKPDNVFIVKEKAGRRDFVKILDFGISKFSSLAGEAGRMTRTGAIMGTPFYMSPEQARAAHEVDTRSDLYSVGVILYEAVTGSVPFHASTFAELLFKIVFEPPPDPRSAVADLDDDFAELVMKAMAREPSARYQTAKEMAVALSTWRGDSAGVLATQIRRQPPGRPAAPQASPEAGAPVPAAMPPQTATLPGGIDAAAMAETCPSVPGHLLAAPPASGGSAIAAGGAAAPSDDLDETTSLAGPGRPAPGPRLSQSIAAFPVPHAPQHAASAGTSAPGRIVDAQESWDGGSFPQMRSLPAPPRPRTGIFLAVAVVALFAGGGAAAFLASTGRRAAAALDAPTAVPAAAPPAPIPSAAGTEVARADPPSGAAPAAAGPAPSASASARPADVASVPASPPRPGPPPRPGKPAAPARPGAPPPGKAKPSSAVTDFGY